MAPYIPPVIFSKEKIAWELMKFVLHTVGRRLFEDNCEREALKFSNAKVKLHAALRRRYGLPPAPPHTRYSIPPRIAKSDRDVIAYWKAMQPDPIRLREWQVREAERMLKDGQLSTGHAFHREFDRETWQLDRDYNLWQAAYEADVALYQEGIHNFEDEDDWEDRDSDNHTRDDDEDWEDRDSEELPQDCW